MVQAAVKLKARSRAARPEPGITPAVVLERLSGFNVTLQKLEIFSTVADLASVTRAAEVLGIAQPAVSAHLRDLEFRLGVTLVARKGRNIVVTEIGEHVHDWAKDIILRSLELKRALRGFADGSSGSAVLATSMSVGTYVIPDLLSSYHKLSPDLRIDVRISNPRDAMQFVRTGVCDMAVLIRDPKQSADGLVFERLWEEELVLVKSPTSIHVGDEIEPDVISNLPFISPPKGLVARDLEDGGLAAHGIVRNNVSLEFGHPEAIKRAIRADVGVGLLFRTAVQDELDSGVLTEVKTRHLRISETLFLAYRYRKKFTPGQGKLLAYLREARPRGIMRFDSIIDA